MFTAIVISICATAAILFFRDQIKYPKFCRQTVSRRLKTASHLLALGEFEEAEKELTPLVNKGLGGKETILLYVRALRENKRHEQALHILFDAARDTPEELLFRHEEAKILLEIGEPHEALASFKVCAPILRSPSDLTDVAQAYFNAGYVDHAWEIVEPLYTHTASGRLLALAGDIFLEKRRFADAIACYENALTTDWQTHDVQNKLGHATRRLGNLADAEQIFRKILEKDPSDVTATLGLGACFQERGHYQKALLIYQSDKAWEACDPRILEQAAQCALRTQKYVFAADYLSQLMEIQGETPQHLLSYGFSLEGQEKWQEAEQTYLKLIHAYPADPNGYRALAWLFGVGLAATLCPERALSLAHIALKIHADALSWEILSACEARVGNFARAHQIQESLASLDGDRHTRQRHHLAMRQLRKQQPLEEGLVSHILVA